MRRSMAIASQLKKREKSIYFLVDGDRTAIDLLKSKEFKADRFSKESFKLFRPKMVVIDQKGDVSPQIKQLRSNGTKICLFDNTSKARLISDIVIFPVSHFRDNLSWKGFKGKKYIGAKYFPLNEEFLKAKKKKHGTFTILVTMGGSDTNKLTQKVCNTLKHIKHDFRAIIVMGSAFGKQHIPADRRFTIVRNPKNMAKLMACSDLAVTAFGTTLYELAYMGVPALIIGNYKQDVNDARIFTKYGTAFWLGNYNDIKNDVIENSICGHINNPKNMVKSSSNGKKLVDGQGVRRIRDILAY
jgi:spore coat polysaccharide biosynthesis predicted glycosyltransferase SpsG